MNEDNSNVAVVKDSEIKTLKKRCKRLEQENIKHHNELKRLEQIMKAISEAHNQLVVQFAQSRKSNVTKSGIIKHL